MSDRVSVGVGGDVITFEDHRWYTIVRLNGEFLRAFAGGGEFSGLGTFETQAEFDQWREGS